MPNAILDPTGGAPVRPAATGPARAPRRTDLSGARVGLLENTKHNADLLLTELGSLLVTEHGAAAVALVRTKQAFALPAPDELVAEFVAGCDVVITGVGDCGSCSASAVADGVVFEAAGLPAAVICSDAFVTTADAMAALKGAPGYVYATTPHPVAILTPSQVADRARHLAPQIVTLLTDPGGERTARSAGSAGPTRHSPSEGGAGGGERTARSAGPAGPMRHSPGPVRGDGAS